MPDGAGPGEWTDLAATRPGANVAAEAEALRAAAPVRTFIARLFDLHTDERAWRVGAKGEQLVADQLRRLGPSWHVINSVVLSEAGTDVDHLVIGPGGVFCLNTKNHPEAKVWIAGDTFLVNGQRQHYVRASRSEGKKVSRLLSAACGFEVIARPVIVLVKCQLPEVKEPPRDVGICLRRGVAEWLTAQPPSLSVEQVESIFSVARRSTTWRQVQSSLNGSEPKPANQRRTPPIPASAGIYMEPAQVTVTEGPSATATLSTTLLISHNLASGTVLRGDPRPHTKLVSAAGLRWSAHQRLWYQPESRGQPPRTELIEHLATELRARGFEVNLQVTES